MALRKRDMGLDWDDFWACVAISLFVAAVLIWADYFSSIMEVARLQ